MANLLGTAKTNSVAPPRYTQMQLQSSAYGLAVPIIYGTTRVGWNLGDYVNFEQHNASSSSGGKGGIAGGGGKGSGTTDLTYTASLLGFLCEGPITGIASSWLSQTQQAGTPGFTVFLGSLAQTPWTYLEDNYASHALNYSGLVYTGAQDYALGSSANMPNVNWEPQAIFQGTAPGTYGGNGCVEGGDADPSLVVPDLLTNPQYGLGFPADRIGQVSSQDEAHSVPGSGPYTIAVNLPDSFLYNINVKRNSDGELFTCVSGTPTAALQYAFDPATGTYTFSSADAGASVNIRYAALLALVDFQNASMALGLWISPAYTDQTQASSILDDIATACFSEFVWSSGVLTLVPRVSTEVSGNDFTYTPPSEPLFSLTIDDFMENSSPIGTQNASYTSDAVIVSRTRMSDQINDVKIEALDRANQYAPAVVESIDQALIDRFGRRSGSTQSLHIFCDLNAANTCANLQIQDQYIRNSYSFQLDERYILLDPMDVVELTDPAFPGLTDVAVRLLEIQENDDSTLSFSAEEYPGTIGIVAEFTLDGAQGAIQDFDVDPGDAATPAVFDVPVVGVQKIGLETWLGTHSATGNPNWGGCEIWIASQSAGPYTYAGQLLGASRMGTLSANFASGIDPDTVNTLSVDLTESQGVLVAGTTGDADVGNTICFVDGEYVAYSDVTVTGTNTYNLDTYIRRGQWGSSIGAHSSGALFVRLDDRVAKLPFTAADVGQTIYIKLLSFNIYLGHTQDLSSVSYYSHTIGGPPTIYAPSALSVTPTIKGNLLTWINAPDVGIAATEIWRSTTSSFSGATQQPDAAGYAQSALDQNASSITQYWYWIRHRDIAGNEGLFYPSTSGAGETAVTGQAATDDIEDNAITAAKIAAGAITDLAFAAGLAPVWVVTSLPGTAPDGQLAVLTTDGKLYRYVSGAWTRAVDGADIIANSIVAGTLQVGAVNATAIVAQDILVTGHLVANAVTAPTVGAGGSSTMNGSGFGVLVAVTVSTAGGPIMADFTDWFARSGGHSPTCNYKITGPNGDLTTIELGGSGVPTALAVCGTALDTTVSGVPGTYTYYLQAWSNGDTACTSEAPVLRLTELRR